MSFHLKDGLYFERTAEGVRIVKTYDGREPRPDNTVMDLTTDVSGFASVMASMCAFGETAETWEEAKRFLERPYPGDDAAYERWKKMSNERNPYCTCVARGDDDPHKDTCPFWKFVLMLRATWPGRNDYRPSPQPDAAMSQQEGK